MRPNPEVSVRQPHEELCELLEEECRRQGRTARALEGQRQAANARDLERLEACTKELEETAQEGARAEARRRELVRRIEAEAPSPGPARNLTSIISGAPAPLRERMLELQQELQTVLSSCLRLSRDNTRVLRAHVRANGPVEEGGEDDRYAHQRYCSRGMHAAYLKMDPAFMDQKG